MKKISYGQNLKLAFFRLFGMFSRLANALTGGSYKTSVSGRVGYHEQLGNRYWSVLAWLINSAFYPLDGRNHCKKVYESEKKLGFAHSTGKPYFFYILSFIVLISTLVLAPINWLLSLVIK